MPRPSSTDRVAVDRAREGEVASVDEIEVPVAAQRLHGLGLGYVDVGLLASVRLSPGWTVWTRDTRLRAVARRLGVDHDPPDDRA